MQTNSLHLSSGTPVNLGPEIGRGGEGAVYEVAGSPDLVAKIYTDGRADDRRKKIEAMVGAGLHRQAAHISFPVDVLFDDKRRFVGFTMRRIRAARPIHQLWGSRDRQEKFPDASVTFMVRVAGNAARAVGELHQAGCVIGDINESGFLVTDQATVVLIDSDSIQFTAGSRVFPCVVGTPQYLPPEHQSVNQRQLRSRAPNHDSFGLAVMIFRLLMSGTHPFMGIWNGFGDPPALPKWIEEFRYAYGADAARMKIGPQPAAPPVDWLSEEIRSAFDQAFGKSGVRARPTAADWIGLLDRLEKVLVQCGRSRYHQHRSGTRSCPWCSTEKVRGKALFGSPPSPPPNLKQQAYNPPPPGPGSTKAWSASPPAPNNSLRNTALAIVGVTVTAIWLFGGADEQAPRVALQPSPEPPQVAADNYVDPRVSEAQSIPFRAFPIEAGLYATSQTLCDQEFSLVGDFRSPLISIEGNQVRQGSNTLCTAQLAGSSSSVFTFRGRCDQKGANAYEGEWTWQITSPSAFKVLTGVNNGNSYVKCEVTTLTSPSKSNLAKQLESEETFSPNFATPNLKETKSDTASSETAAKESGSQEEAWSRGASDRKEVQGRLTSLGFSLGAIDGVFGSSTRDAIRAWQTSVGVSGDGYLDASEYENLKLVSEGAYRDWLNSREGQTHSNSDVPSIGKSSAADDCNEEKKILLVNGAMCLTRCGRAIKAKENPRACFQ